MAVRISKIHGGKPIVNIYEVADDFMTDERLSVRKRQLNGRILL